LRSIGLLIAILFITITLHNVYSCPIGLQLISDCGGQDRTNTLTHFTSTTVKGGIPIFRNMDKRVGDKYSFVFSGLKGNWQNHAQHQSSSTYATGFEEFASIYFL
jgi:hypothetical protein